ncbi:ABC transporter permease [Luteibaculum oceani]|uniref:ABC transporter permease n=2 Tax=Luteibaculum oceani TaxID=1294296 RepID=A0A5C6V374_9FLAO|nr:ABC transporter permease [Luteibaculum oceani]
MSGTLVSLSVGLISVVISLLIGVFLGGLAGYFGGWLDAAIMWVVNVVWSIPTLLMVMAITLALGKGFVQVFIAVGLTMWVEVARVTRGRFMEIKQLDYVMAARLFNTPPLKIIFREMLPNAVGPLIVIAAGNFSTAILLEAGLSFLGIGAQVPMASWGGMIKDHFSYLTTDAAFIPIVPGVAIMLLVLSFIWVGNTLRDTTDVKA